MPVGPRLSPRSLPAAVTHCWQPALETLAKPWPSGSSSVVGSNACKPMWMSNGVAMKERSVVDTGGLPGSARWPKPKHWTSNV